jgi:hypothetical protein
MQEKIDANCILYQGFQCRNNVDKGKTSKMFDSRTLESGRRPKLSRKT